MQISVVLAHPGQKSFNHAIAEAVVSAAEQHGHEVRFHDLYAEHFDPLITAVEFPKDADLPVDIAWHCLEIAAADGIVIVHPNWWGQPPAILKGWVDRVIRPGVAYQFDEGDDGEGVPVGLLKAGTALVFNTSNTPERREREIFGDPLEALWKNCIFDFCGVKSFYRRMFSVVVTSTEQQRQDWLAEVRAATQRFFPAQ